MSSLPPSDHKSEITTLDAVAKRENLNCISKFRLPTSVAQHIDLCLILHDVHINNPTIASDVELNSRVLNCLESYQLNPSLVVNLMLEVFREEFHGWGYTKFSRLDRNIRRVLKKTFMAKGIYMDRPSGHVNQRLAKFVIDEQLPIWDKNNLRKYKKIYPTSKAWILLESEFDFPVPQQLTPSIKPTVPYMPQGLNSTTQLQVIQDDIPTAWIRTTQVRKTEITKPIPDNTDCILSPGSTEDVLEGLSALFPDCEPLDEMMQVHDSSVGIVKDFEHHDVGESDTCGPDTKNHRQNTSARLKPVFISRPGIRKKILKKKETVQKFEAEAMKKAGMGIAEEMFVGLDGFVGGRPIQRARKCDDHG